MKSIIALLSLVSLISVFVVHADAPSLAKVLSENESMGDQIAAIQVQIDEAKKTIAEGSTPQAPVPPGMVVIDATCSALPPSQCITEGEWDALEKGVNDAGGTIEPAANNKLAQELIQARVDLIIGNAKEYEVGSEETTSGFPVSRIEEVRQLSSRLRESVLIFKSYTDGSDGGEPTIGSATAFLIEPDLAVTNSHNVRDGPGGPLSKGTVVLHTFHGKTVNASLVGDHIGADIALLRLGRALQLPVLNWGDSRNLSAGDPLFIIGHPAGMGSWVTHVGVFDQLKAIGPVHSTLYQEQVLFTAPCMQGCSGSPVFDMNGDVVAVLHGVRSTEDAPLPLELHTSVRFLSKETTLATAAHQASALVTEFLAPAPTPQPASTTVTSTVIPPTPNTLPGEGKVSSD